MAQAQSKPQQNRTQQQNRPAGRGNIVAVEQLLRDNSEAIGKSLPPHMDADYLIGAVMKCLKNPDPRNKLPFCTPESVLEAAKQAASVGLTPDSFFSQGYLIPYGENAVFQISYLGLIELARRDGYFKKINAQVRYANDFFDIQQGTEEKLIHRPGTDEAGKRGEPIGAWSCAWLANGMTQFEYMTRDEIEYIRRTYSKQPNGEAWSKAWGPMAMKTVAIRLVKWFPKSIKLQAQLEYEAKYENLLEAVADEYERRQTERASITTDSLRPSASPNRGHDESIPETDKRSGKMEHAGKAAEKTFKDDKRFDPKLQPGDFRGKELDEIQAWMEATNKTMSLEEFLGAYSGTTEQLMELVRNGNGKQSAQPTQQAEQSGPDRLTWKSLTLQQKNQLKPWLELRGYTSADQVNAFLKDWTEDAAALIDFAEQEIARQPTEEVQQETVGTGGQSRKLF